MMLKEEKHTMSQTEILIEIKKNVQKAIQRNNITPEEIEAIKKDLLK